MLEKSLKKRLMAKMTLGEFKARYGEHRAIEATGKKRMIHDATHEVRVNHRINCRDKIRNSCDRHRP